MESFDSLDITTLTAKLDEITRANDFLRKENETLNSYLRRHVSAEEAEEWADEDNRRGRKGKNRKLRSTTLTVDQKLDIATAESDAVKKEATAFEAVSSKKIDSLKAVLEQTDQRINALKKEAFEFKRDVVIAGENERTGKTMAEKVVKYFNDQILAKDGVVDKLKLKNQTLRAQLTKLESSLKQKDEVGDVLHYIDFHQLQIENKQYLAKIEEKNKELLRLKSSTGQTVQMLNAMKLKLAEISKESVRIRAEIRARTALLSRIRHDNAELAHQVATAREVAAALAKSVSESVDMPTIMDYVELKALEANLDKEMASWERKLEIMSLTARQETNKLKIGDSITAAEFRASGRVFTPAPPTAEAVMPQSPLVLPPTPLSSTLGTFAATRGMSREANDAVKPWRTGTMATGMPKGVGGFGGSKAGGVLMLGSTAGMARSVAKR